MFVCTSCNTKDYFQLMFSPDYKGNKEYSVCYNDKKELEITVDGYTFIPDLQFMNGYAVCKKCGQLYSWDYKF